MYTCVHHMSSISSYQPHNKVDHMHVHIIIVHVFFNFIIQAELSCGNNKVLPPEGTCGEKGMCACVYVIGDLYQLQRVALA